MMMNGQVARTLGLGAALASILAIACARPVVVPPRAIIAADSAVAAGLAREESIDASTFPPTSVGVLPLTVISEDPSLEPLGYGLAVLLATDLARSSSVDVVDRLRVEALLREASLARSGVVDSLRAPRAGRILGARYLVVGSLSDGPGQDLLVDTRLATTVDATVRPVVTGTASVDEILEAEKSVVFGILDALGVSPTPAEQAAIERHPTRSLGALLAFSRGARAESELRLYDALMEYREALRLDPRFEQAGQRVDELATAVPDQLPLAALTVDAINGTGPGDLTDVADPAFYRGGTAVLVLPIIVR